MKRAVITGATGAIGTALIKEFIKNGIEVLVFCRQDSARTGNIPVSPLVTVKYCALDGLENVQNDTGKDWDAFYHFAWAGTTGAARNDMQLQNLNVKYALDAVGAAKRFGCKTFIGAGSQAEYGRAEGKLTPLTPAFPENGYGMAKLCTGQMTRVEAEKFGLKHIWVRVLSIYGENDGKNSMISSLITKLKNGEVPQTTAGEQMWDYLYSGDAARAFCMLAESGKNGKIY
ncbi:MAG: NAD-dependent epimerase/dehydratase family protein, partial [Firmicutes bacterium]|nr:NAD-dependent epimerase/dehydratase family protein [Bacillota bacterium]